MSYALDDLWPSPEIAELARTVRRFVRDEVRPAERDLAHDAVDLPGDVLAALQEKARSAGLWAVATSARHGGSDLPLTARVAVAFEAAQHTIGAYNPGGGAFGFDPPGFVLDRGSPEVRRWAHEALHRGRRWFFAMTESSGGSDPRRAIRLRAQRSGDGYVLNGSKTFVSHFDRSAWGLVFARADGGITCFAVPSGLPNVSHRPIPVIRPDTPFELDFTDVEVPADWCIGEEGEGLALGGQWLVENRIAYGAGCAGVGVAALDAALGFVTSRSTFDAPLQSRQAVQWMLADSHLELSSALLVALQAARAEPGSESQRVLASMAKLAGSEAGWRATDRAVQLLGGLGVCRDLPLERWLRELRVKRIGEGPSEIQRMLVAKWVLSQV